MVCSGLQHPTIQSCGSWGSRKHIIILTWNLQNLVLNKNSTFDFNFKALCCLSEPYKTQTILFPFSFFCFTPRRLCCQQWISLQNSVWPRFGFWFNFLFHALNSPRMCDPACTLRQSSQHWQSPEPHWNYWGLGKPAGFLWSCSAQPLAPQSSPFPRCTWSKDGIGETLRNKTWHFASY